MTEHHVVGMGGGWSLMTYMFKAKGRGSPTLPISYTFRHAMGRIHIGPHDFHVPLRYPACTKVVLPSVYGGHYMAHDVQRMLQLTSQLVFSN